MTQIELEKRIAELNADYVTKRNATEKAIEDVRREIRELEQNYHSAVRDCKERIANLTEKKNQYKEDYTIARSKIFLEDEGNN